MTRVRWWQTAQWRQRLQNHLWLRSRRRYTLELSLHPPLGATSPRQRLVHIQPEGLPFPTDANVRAQIRYAPRTATAFERAITWLLIEHESAHCRFSGTKPAQPTLGWLWNSLEDQRIEALMAGLYPGLAEGFTMLGDAVWVRLPTTTDLLDGCLWHRFEHTRPPQEWKFRPSPSEQPLWDEHILPLLHQAWTAPSSKEVSSIARNILRLLRRDADAPPPQPPIDVCGCAGGAGQMPPELNEPTEEPPAAGGVFRGAGIGKGRGHDPRNPRQADPTALLTIVEGLARRMAQELAPPAQHAFPQPHRSRGEINLDRVIEHSQRPFDAPAVPHARRSLALMTVVDESGSMRSFMPAAREVTMLLDRAAELARIPLGIVGFDDQPTPILLRPLRAGPDLVAQRRIAGMQASGGTRMAPALQLAIQLLGTQAAERKILLLLHDGQPDAADWAITAHLMQTLPRDILVQPLYLGTNPTIIAANTALFGHVLACASLDALRGRLCAWLRTI